MKVCLASLHPRILSGQIDSLAGLGRALERRGHEVSLVAPFDTSQLLRQALHEIDTGPKHLLSGAKAMLQAVPRIVDASHEADVLHVAVPTPAFGWVADLIRSTSKTPVLVSFEGHLAHAEQVLGALRRPRSLKSYLPLWLVNNGLFGRMSARLCERYVVSSEYQRSELLELGIPPERITVLTNVVEDSKLASCDQPCAREQLNLPPGRQIVGYIGHFNDVKGVDLLASAFASLAGDRQDVHLALAWSGQGDPRPIERTLSEVRRNVTWLGKVHVGTFLCAIDVLSLPYRSTAGQGAFPSLVLEALCAGRPLVTTALPLLSEIAEDERVALLCPPERPDLLARQLDRLLGSEELRRQMSREQIALARRRFAPARLAARYESLYTSLLEDAEPSLRAAA
ncbi:MAG TPA: glycosyltransferase family 4 protein [Chloroflexota bacterium]|nr:glycosyltransferase family 4 protein [Chloroflexota bacterium]